MLFKWDDDGFDVDAVTCLAPAKPAIAYARSEMTPTPHSEEAVAGGSGNQSDRTIGMLLTRKDVNPIDDSW